MIIVALQLHCRKNMSLVTFDDFLVGVSDSLGIIMIQITIVITTMVVNLITIIIATLVLLIFTWRAGCR